jgi:hypothetical protein
MLSLVLRKASFFVLCPAFFMLTTGWAVAQEENGARLARSEQVVTATTTAARLRLAAPNAVVQLRLEVYDDNARKVFDTEQRGGNVLDWPLQGGNGERLPDGSYVCLVTVKSLSGRLSQKLGQINIAAQEASINTIAPEQLTVAQTQAVGPVEAGPALTVLASNDQGAVTTLVHNGADAQLTRTRGALSFRVGDFFSGKDAEQMRLTEDGNVGIGTAKPKVKLDVAGMIRAREGFAFSDGSKLNVNDKGALILTDSNGTIVPNVAGTGTQNRLTKWTDNNGILGDSFVAEAGGTGLQLTAPPSTQTDTNLLFLNSTNGTTGMLAGSTPSFGANNGPFFAMRGNTYTTFPNQRGLFAISAGNVANPQGDEGSVKFTTGNDQLRMLIKPDGDVGIGTTSPNDKLEVKGATGRGGAIITGGTAGSTNHAFVVRDSNLNQLLRVQTNGNVGVGTISPQARLDVRGDIKLGSSGQLFAPGSQENLRIVNGYVDKNGDIKSGAGFRVVHTEAGVYDIFFNPAFAGLPTIVASVDLCDSAGTCSHTFLIHTEGVTANRVRFWILKDSAPSYESHPFHFIAIGPR